jgi:hypothetical protein
VCRIGADISPEWIVEIIRVHGPGGDEAEDGVLLELA